jgi:hypothetical protein
MHPEDIFRSANDRIAERARELGWASSVPFLCECSDSRCFARLDLTLDEYAQVREHPQRYAVHASHEVAEAFLVEENGDLALVEKLWPASAG